MKTHPAPIIHSLNVPEFKVPEKTILKNQIEIFEFPGIVPEISRIDIVFNSGKWSESSPMLANSVAKLFKSGTPHKSAFQLSESIDFLGSTINVFAGYHGFTISIYSMRKNLIKTLNLMMECLKENVFPEDEYENYIKNLSSRQSIREEKTELIADRALKNSIFGKNHPYGYEAAQEYIDQLSLEEIRKYFKNEIQAKKPTIYISGTFGDEEIQFLGHLFSNETYIHTEENIQHSIISSPNYIQNIKKAKSAQTSLAIGTSSIDRSHEDYAKLSLTNTIFGGYFGSRLMSNIREEKGYTYGIYSILQTYKNSGAIFVQTETSPQHAKACIHEIKSEIHKLQEDLISDDEMKQARNYLLGKYLGRMDGAFAQMEIFKNYQIEGIDIQYFNKFADTILNMEKDVVIEMAQKHYNFGSIYQITVGNYMKNILMKFIFYILIIFSSFQSSKAQIQAAFTGTAPELLCVRNETSNQIAIQWNGSAQPGACFLQYGVYISLNDKNGPYQKIDSVSSSASGTLTFDPNYNGIVYVYLINEQSCPDASITKIQTSDTLNNIVPQPAPNIVKISVDNNNPVLQWEASKNPEVTGYAIYSISNNYNEPIDTVIGRNSTVYKNLIHQASDSVAVFKIRSIEYCEDPKGLFSNITPPYNTIKINRSDENLCKRSVLLNWNGYNNQGFGVIGYKVEYSQDAGNTWIEKEIIPDTARKYDFIGLLPQATTCIRIQAILPNQDSSLSNVICVYSQGLIPVENHYIQNITVNSDNVSMEYIPDPNAVIGEIVLERSSSGDQFTVLGNGVSIQKDGIENIYFIKDFSALTNRSALYYRVSVRDECSNKYSTLPAKTILTKGKNLGLNNEINWDLSAIDSNTILGYDIYRVIEGDTSLIFSSNSDGTFTDANIYTNNFYAEACYFVTAQHQSSNLNRPQDVLKSNSNTVCLEPTPQAFVPNAFAPSGYNKIFKPILIFGSDIDYSFEIFNRLGTKVFESNEPNIGWNGEFKGKITALDSYVYHLKFTGLDGQIYRKTGFVVLVQ